MRRVLRSTVVTLALLAVTAGTVATCGGGDDHAGHDHKEGESHAEHPADKAK